MAHTLLDLRITQKEFGEMAGIHRCTLSDIMYGNRSGVETWPKVWQTVEELQIKTQNDKDIA